MYFNFFWFPFYVYFLRKFKKRKEKQNSECHLFTIFFSPSGPIEITIPSSTITNNTRNTDFHTEKKKTKKSVCAPNKKKKVQNANIPMFRRSVNPRLGLFSIIKEELGKAKELLKYDLSSYGKFLTGEDMSEREKKIRAKHHELAQKDAAAAAEARQTMSWKEKMAAALQDLKNSTRTNAAVVALVQHCARAHMAEVAVEQDIDVRNISIVAETVKSERGAAAEEKVIGYIEAPTATNEEVMVYARKLEKACPAARAHAAIEWRRSPKTPDPYASSSASFRGRDEEFDFPSGSDDLSGEHKRRGSGFSLDNSFVEEPTVADSSAADNNNNNNNGKTENPSKVVVGEVPASSASFEPRIKKSGNDHTDLNRTAYDLGEALEKAKRQARLLEEETERAAKQEAVAEGMPDEGNNNERNVNENKNDDVDAPIPPSSSPNTGFASMKQMGLFGSARGAVKVGGDSNVEGELGQSAVTGFQHMKSTKPPEK